MFRNALKYTLTFLILCLPLEQSKASENTVTVFAASSLYQAMEEVLDNYRTQSKQKVISAYASSSSLARQISQGAPADLYISANIKWVEYLQQQNMLEINSRKNLLKNQLVVITHNDSPITPTSINRQLFSQLSNSQRLAISDPDHVPLGMYTREALQHYLLWSPVKPFLASTHNARSTLNLVERNEVSLGISYLSDAKNSSKVKIIAEFLPQSHSDILYPVSIVKNRQTKNTLALYNFLFSTTATKIFTQYGFSVVDESDN